MLARLIKLAGLVPMLGGGLADKIVDIDFLKELDLLKGFQGIRPHLMAFLACVVAGIWSRLRYKTRTDQKNDLSRRRWSTAAVVFFGPCLLLAFLPLPDTDFFQNMANTRWYLASLLYILFYLCLGASIP
jgi:hypothetical protein